MSQTPEDFSDKIHHDDKMRDFKRVFVKRFILIYILLIVIIGYLINLAVDYTNNLNLELSKEKLILFFCPGKKTIEILSDKDSSINTIKTNSFGQLLIDFKTQSPYFLSKDKKLISFDAVKKEAAKVYQLNFKPLYGVFAYNGNLYVSDSKYNNVYSYSPFFEKITHTIKFNFPYQNFSVSSRYQNLAFYNNLKESLDILNLKNNTLERFSNINQIRKIIITLLENKFIILSRNNKFFIVNSEIMKIEKIFSAGGYISDFALNNNPIFHKFIYAVDAQLKKLYVIKSGKIFEEKKLKYEPALIALSPEGYYAYIYYKQSRKLEKINLVNLKSVKMFNLKDINASQMIITSGKL